MAELVAQAGANDLPRTAGKAVRRAGKQAGKQAGRSWKGKPCAKSYGVPVKAWHPLVEQLRVAIKAGEVGSIHQAAKLLKCRRYMAGLLYRAAVLSLELYK